MSSSTSSGAASAPEPSAFCGPAVCRRSPAWATRSSPDTNPSAASLPPAPRSGCRVGDSRVRAGARCFGEVKGLFGGAASRLVVPGNRVVPIDEDLGEQGVLIALAATAYHAIQGGELSRSHRRPRRSRPPARPRHASRSAARRRSSGRHNPDRHDGAEGYHVDCSPSDEHARIPLHLRRERRRRALSTR